MRNLLYVFTLVAILSLVFGGGLPLAIAAGVDAPRWLLARAGGLPMVIPPLGSYQSGLRMTRFDNSYFLDEGVDERFVRVG